MNQNPDNSNVQNLQLLSRAPPLCPRPCSPWPLCTFPKTLHETSSLDMISACRCGNLARKAASGLLRVGGAMRQAPCRESSIEGTLWAKAATQSWAMEPLATQSGPPTAFSLARTGRSQCDRVRFCFQGRNSFRRAPGRCQNLSKGKA